MASIATNDVRVVWKRLRRIQKFCCLSTDKTSTNLEAMHRLLHAFSFNINQLTHTNDLVLHVGRLVSMAGLGDKPTLCYIISPRYSLRMFFFFVPCILSVNLAVES